MPTRRVGSRRASCRPSVVLGAYGRVSSRAVAAASPPKAIDFALRAGEAAAGVFAYEQALMHWQTALRLMERHAAGLDQRLSVLERLAELTRIIGFDHYPQAISYWGRPSSSARPTGWLNAPPKHGAVWASCSRPTRRRWISLLR
jgi:hypothetical protein